MAFLGGWFNNFKWNASTKPINRKVYIENRMEEEDDDINDNNKDGLSDDEEDIDNNDYNEMPMGYNIDETNHQPLDNFKKNEKKKRKQAYDILLNNNVNPKVKQRTQGYKTLQQISASKQVPLQEVKAMRRDLKTNNNIIPADIVLPSTVMDIFNDNSNSRNWNQRSNDEAVDALIENAGKGQRDEGYISSKGIAAMCGINENSVKRYKKILSENGNIKFTPTEPNIGRTKATGILTQSIVDKIKADKRMKNGASDETTTRVIWDAQKLDAQENGLNTFAIQEPIYDARLKGEMNVWGFFTDRQAQAKTKARLDASGDFFSMLAAAGIYYVIAYYIPVDKDGNPTGKEPTVHKRRIHQNMILNADMTSVMFGHGISDKFPITIAAGRLAELEAIGLSGVFNRSNDSNNTKRRTIALYPTVTQRGDMVVAVFCATEETATEIKIIALEDNVPEAIYFAVRPPNKKDDPTLDNTAFMKEIHTKCVYPSLVKWREHCIEKECIEYDKQYADGLIDEFTRDELKVECYATHALIHFTADGDYAQVNMLNMEDMKKIVRELNIINQKWSAGCSLFQNALDKAKSYMLLNHIVKNVKTKGFHQHQSPPRWYDRLKAFTKKVFSANSARTMDVFFSHVGSFFETIFKRTIIQEGFRFTGFGEDFKLDIALGQFYDYKDWSDEKRNKVHALFWKEVIPKADTDRCLSPQFLHGIFKEILDLEDFDIMNNKDKRPLNGQYACDMNPNVIAQLQTRRSASMELIEQRRTDQKAIEAAMKELEKAAKKERKKQLLGPTIKKRDDDIADLVKRCNDEKKSITESNKSILNELNLNLKNAKTSVKIDSAKKAIDSLKSNAKASKKAIDEKYAALKLKVKSDAKRMIDLLLQSTGYDSADDDENQEEQLAGDNGDNDDNDDIE